MRVTNFAENENLTQTGDVALLVTVFGDGETWRFTNVEIPLVWNGVQYEPIAMESKNIISGVEERSDELTVTMSRSTTLADRFFPTPTRTIYAITIRQVAHTQGQVHGGPLMFTGAIMSASGHEAGSDHMKLECTTQMGLRSRGGLGRRYQIPCPLLLYGRECRASKEDAKFLARISTTTGNTSTNGHVAIEFFGEDADQPHIWRGRDLNIESNRLFMITSELEMLAQTWEVSDVLPRGNRSANEFRLLIRTDQAQSLRDAVDALDPSLRYVMVTPGCDHTLTACQQIFSNAPNYGGQPALPTENPIKTVFVGM